MNIKEVLIKQANIHEHLIEKNLEKMAELRKQIKDLEDANKVHMQEIRKIMVEIGEME